MFRADDSGLVPAAADDLRGLGVILYGVGVGREVNKEQLRVSPIMPIIKEALRCKYEPSYC